MAVGVLVPLMSEAKKQFAQNLKTLLTNSNWSQAQFAEKLGIQESTISHWLHQRSWPDARQVDLIMDKTKWTMTQLFAGVNPTLEETIKMHNASGSPFYIGLK